MNKLGFGFLRLPKREDSFDWDLVDQMVDLYMESGNNYFDTCYTYLNGMSEHGIKRCVVERFDRNSVMIADKLPGYDCKNDEDCQRFFEIELERCGVDYFDVFLLHWLNGENYDIAEKYDQFLFLREKKEAGLAKRIGFSYHDDSRLLDEILTRHPEVDLVQLQINYLDWESAGVEARKCYETCVKHGKKIIVMEPVRGGSLARIPKEAEDKLKAVHADWTPADWALRFVQSLPEVEICLSGMNSMEQMRANIQDFEPLTKEEMELLLSIVPIIHGKTAVPCTACRYCVPHCPKKIEIPEYFKMYNEIKRYPEEDWKIIPSYRQLERRSGTPAECIRCRNCQKHCPQNIAIADKMKEVAERFK